MKILIEQEPSVGFGNQDSAILPHHTVTAAVPSRKDSVHALFACICTHLQSKGVIRSADFLVKDLLAREASGSTVIADQLANPHAQGSFVDECLLLYLRLSRPIPQWDGSHDVSRLLLILIPQNPSMKDLQYLRDLYRRMGDEKVLGLLGTGSIKDVRQILTTEGK
ncbi:MAG: PTS sugar transporter subunit IIA [Bifidobacteriales bacterium]|nr:PTS sugar transporter subunit IIA [Bifidobacterium sp.]MCT6918297.1 PTS sugar transporter subunit IIA [Bifidobacteriales bacterium]